MGSRGENGPTFSGRAGAWNHTDRSARAVSCSAWLSDGPFAAVAAF